MDLKLYIRQFCPYCRKVLAAIDQMGRTDIELHDIGKSEEDRRYLNQVGGKEQVPCLFIKGEPMYESDDIIAWLKANQ